MQSLGVLFNKEIYNLTIVPLFIVISIVTTPAFEPVVVIFKTPLSQKRVGSVVWLWVEVMVISSISVQSVLLFERLVAVISSPTPIPAPAHA